MCAEVQGEAASLREQAPAGADALAGLDPQVLAG